MTRRVVFVSGTGTGIGKTWWAAAVLRALREQRVAVAARKPAQSFAPGDPTTDAEVLGLATGEDPVRVCPRHRWYERPLAPPMAANELGRPAFTIAELAAETDRPDHAVTLVEGAGGPRSPIASDGDNVDLARALGVDVVVLVADAGLGTINAVRLAAATFTDIPLVVALNRFGTGPLPTANREWLADRDGFDVETDPSRLAARWTTPRV